MPNSAPRAKAARAPQNASILKATSPSTSVSYNNTANTRIACTEKKSSSIMRSMTRSSQNCTKNVQQYLWSRRTNTWLRNRKHCYAYGRRCGYFEVCSARPEEVDQYVEMYLQPKPGTHRTPRTPRRIQSENRNPRSKNQCRYLHRRLNRNMTRDF